MKGSFRFLIGCYFLLVNSEPELSTWEMRYTAGTAQMGDARWTGWPSVWVRDQLHLAEAVVQH